MRRRRVALLLVVSGAVTSCGSAPSPVAALVEPALPTPEVCVEGDLKERLVIDWSPHDRSKLEAALRKGVVAVKVDGCRVRLVDGCAAKRPYTYVATSRQREVTFVKGVDELGLQLPILASRVGGALERSSTLSLTFNVVGRYESEAVRGSDELEGDCSEATHVVASLSVGSFEVAARTAARAHAEADVLLASSGGKSSSEHELLDSAGVEARCVESRRADVAPPEDCGLPLRVELRRLAHDGAIARPRPDAPPPPAPAPMPAAGDTSPALTDALASTHWAVDRCYRRALASDQHLSGDLTLFISVARDGRVRSVKAEHDVTDQLAECAVSQVSDLRWPTSADTRPRLFVVPLRFRSARRG